MGKINSSEKFYIQKISQGLNILKKELNQHKLEKILSSSLEEDKQLNKDIKEALDIIYISETKDNKTLKMKYKDNLIKIYKGRETFLKYSIIKWYSTSKLSIKNRILLTKKSLSKNRKICD